MVITIELFMCAGAPKDVRLSNLTLTAVTADGRLTRYWEQVVEVTKDGCDILDLQGRKGTTFYVKRLGRLV